MRWSRRFLHSLSLPALAGALLFAHAARADGWPVSRGNPAATGANNIETSAAERPSIISRGFGRFADGVGPVISADNTMVLASWDGKITVLQNGNPFWSRQLNSGFTIQSTPAIASNGNIYVLSSYTYTDHRVTPAVKRFEVEINGFDPGGGWLFHYPVPAPAGGAIATAPLNIMRAPGGAELIVFPIRYRPPASTSNIVHLYAYSLTGSLEAKVSVLAYTAPIESDGFPDGGFSVPQTYSDQLTEPVKYSVPGVAVTPGDPSIVVLNNGMNALISYRFDGTTFQELWRYNANEATEVRPLSAPAVRSDGITFAAYSNRYYGHNNVGQVVAADGMAGTYAPPAIAPNGRVVFTSRIGKMHVAGIGEREITADTIAPAAISRNFIYVSVSRGLISYRLSDFTLASVYEWPDGDRGGRSEPVIGPNGFIYALAGNKLYTFVRSTGPANRTSVGTGGVVSGNVGGNDAGDTGKPKPMKNTLNPAILTAPQATTDGGSGGNAITGGTVFQAQPNAIMNGGLPAPEQGTDQPPPQEAALPTSQKFDPPLTASGKALSACVDASFDDCGKAAARAYCTSLGFTKASDIDIDTKKVQAETLGGALCTAKKCKVVDKVTCSR